MLEQRPGMFNDNRKSFVAFATRFQQETTVNMTELDIGDVVYAAKTITDDGSMPDCAEGEILAEAGARGVIVMKGHIEDAPRRHVFLVRFEDETLTLGRPIGCWLEDLSVDEKRTPPT